jgi:hypothetical protein
VFVDRTISQQSIIAEGTPLRTIVVPLDVDHPHGNDRTSGIHRLKEVGKKPPKPHPASSLNGS